MKKFGHKNQVVITTMALLLAIVGYISYDYKSKEKPTMSMAGAADTELETEEVVNPGETVLTGARSENCS